MNSDELNVVLKIVSNAPTVDKTDNADDGGVTKKASYKIAQEIDSKAEKKSSENQLQDADISEKASKTKDDEDDKEKKVEAEDKEYTLAAFKSLFVSNKELDDIFSDVGYKNVFNLIDTDKDGVITKKEVEDLDLNLKSLADLTTDDIEKLIENINSEKNENDEEEIAPELLDKLKEILGIDKDKEETDAVTPITTEEIPTYNSYTPSTSIGSSGGTYYSSPSYSTGSGSSGNVTIKPEVTMEELEEKRAEKQEKVDKANDDYQAAVGETNENIVNAKEDLAQKEEAYKEAVCHDDKISDELRGRMLKNQEDIETEEKEQTKYEKKIAQQEEKITSLDSKITSLNSSLEQYKASLSALPSEKTEENKDNWDDIQATRSELKEKISSTEKSIKENEEEKKSAEAAKEFAEDTLKIVKENLEKLEDEREKIEKEIEKVCSDATKEALKAFQEARVNVETVKSQEVSSAQEALNTANEELQEVEEEINELQQKQIQMEYSMTGDGQAVADFLMDLVTDENGNMVPINATQMQQAMTAAGCRFDAGAWCGDFVAYALQQVYGDDVPGDYINTCSNTAYVPTIREWGANKGLLTDDSSQVEPGDIIVYGEQHVGLVVSVNSDGTVNTVEGNTSNSNTGAYSCDDGSEGWCSYHSGVTGSYILLNKA